MSQPIGTLEAPPDAYRFGRNWDAYVRRHLTPERREIAQASVERLVGELAGKSFLDVGCGSGLFSLAAHRLGAARVVSLDVDADSVACCERLRSSAGEPPEWRVVRGSILDEEVVAQLEPADVVYSWGVLHHTGAMYPAIRNAARLVAPGGLFCIAIYNRGASRFMSSERWVGIKRRYNRLPRAGQLAMEGLYFLYLLQGEVRVQRRNPLRMLREYRHRRGMAVWPDIRDWLGGYPYEFATADEITRFCEDELGLATVKVVVESPTGLSNNEFVFRAP